MRKALAIIGALLVGGLGIAIVNLLPHAAEARLSLN